MVIGGLDVKEGMMLNRPATHFDARIITLFPMREAIVIRPRKASSGIRP